MNNENNNENEFNNELNDKIDVNFNNSSYISEEDNVNTVNQMNNFLGSNVIGTNIDEATLREIDEIENNASVSTNYQKTTGDNKVDTGVNKPLKVPETDAKKQRFKYQIINSQGEKVKGYIDAHNISEVKAYLDNEGYQTVKVELSKDIVLGSGKLSYSELAFILTQLSTYLKSGIPLIDAIRILEKQSVKPEKRRIFSNITYELVKGESFSSALEAQGNVFPSFLINMVKTAEMTGDLPEILDDMTEYYTTTDRTRKAAISAMTYPTIIFIFAIAVITFILTYVIPTFVGIFEENNATIPTMTRIVINTSNFLRSNGFYIVGVIALILIVYTILYKNVRSFKKTMQTIYMKLPIFGKLIIYKEVAMFTKTFASLLNHNVFITDSMKILSQVTTNEVYTEIIQDSLSYLSKGAKISDSFKGKWAFPVVAYEMLVTGENTGRLAVMMDYVAKYYDDLHSNYIKRINTLIEPLMIVFLALIVGIVVLSVVIPMFSVYSQLA
ncbi:MAG: type II secretion system F family protein [bacterium]|nr:type II secretion system F family protein [bacterium]